MKRSEYEAKMKELQDKIEALKKVDIEEDDTRWKPEPGDTYYGINSKGNIVSNTWANWGEDNASYSIGNCFKTYEEADFMAEKLKVIAELKDFALTREERNKALEDGFAIYYLNANWHKDIVVDGLESCLCGELYFNTREDAREAINKVGEDRIKKYYLEVE